ncbi:MAG: PEGA domain-containing protein, partial [Caldithrix sp.]|nr:PEGA domain-containing protein [Caldithrix sp.]
DKLDKNTSTGVSDSLRIAMQSNRQTLKWRGIKVILIAGIFYALALLSIRYVQENSAFILIDTKPLKGAYFIDESPLHPTSRQASQVVRLSTAPHTLQFNHFKSGYTSIHHFKLNNGDTLQIDIPFNDSYKTRPPINIKTNPPEALITVNDTLIGTSPLDALTLSPGQHRFKISKSGFLPLEKTIHIKARQAYNLHFNLFPDKASGMDH